MEMDTKLRQKYTVKNVIDGIGHDRAGYQCSLYSDGIKVASVCDDGYGGEVDFKFTNKIAENTFYEEIKKLKEEEKAKGNKSKYFYHDSVLVDSDIFVSELVNDFLDNKMLKKRCKNKIVFQIGEQIGSDNFNQINGIFNRPSIIKYIEQKYPNQKYKIYNDEYTEGFLQSKSSGVNNG